MNTLESILKELISARVEHLAHEAEQHPDCIKAKGWRSMWALSSTSACPTTRSSIVPARP